MPAPTPYFEFAPADRALAVLARETPYLPQLELELEGRLDATRLARALELLARRHPILTATVDPEANRAEWCPGTTAPEFREMVDEGSRARIVALPLDPATGPTCRAVLVVAGDRSRVVLGVHHAVGDGRSLVTLFDDLRLLYLGLGTNDPPPVDVDWSPRSARALLDANGVSAIVRARMTRDAVARWAEVRPSAHRQPAAGGTGADDPGYLDCSVAVETGQLREPRTAVLLALLERAWRSVVGDGLPPSSSTDRSTSWLVAVDARRAFGSVGGVGNLSGLEPVALPGGEDGMEVLTRSAADSLRPLRRPGAGMFAELAASWAGPDAGPLLNSGIRRLYATRAPELQLTRIFSHLDRVPDALAEWGDATGVGLRWMPDPRIVPPIVAAMSTTFLGRTVLTLVASTRACAPATGDALIRHVVRDLAAWSEPARLAR